MYFRRAAGQLVLGIQRCVAQDAVRGAQETHGAADLLQGLRHQVLDHLGPHVLPQRFLAHGRAQVRRRAAEVVRDVLLDVLRPAVARERRMLLPEGGVSVVSLERHVEPGERGAENLAHQPLREPAGERQVADEREVRQRHAAVHHQHRADALRVPRRGHRGDEPAHRMPQQQIHFADFEVVEQGNQVCRVRRHAPGPGDLVAVSTAAMIRRDDPEPRPQLIGQRLEFGVVGGQAVRTQHHRTLRSPDRSV